MQTMTFVEPVAEPWTDSTPAEDPRTTGLVELMLKDRRRLDALIRDEASPPELIPRLLAVALLGFTIFGVAATLIVNLGGEPPSWVPSARWSDGTWASLTLAYVLGLVAATGVCLPSFYFYGLLAGVQAVDAPGGRACGQVPGRHRGGPGGGLADLRGRWRWG